LTTLREKKSPRKSKAKPPRPKYAQNVAAEALPRQYVATIAERACRIFLTKLSH
jgi:hypothetical protein